MFVPQMYNGVPQTIGRCIHISFLKAGFGKAPEQAGGKPDVKHMGLMERFPLPDTNALHSDGYFYLDHIDIKLQRGRYCGHWRSPTAFAEEALAYYQESVEYVQNFPDLAPALKDWLFKGMPRVEQHYGKLNKIQNFEYDALEVPAENLKYESCQTCRYYQPDINADGSPVPFRGKCGLRSTTGAGLFGENVDELPRVYSFMGCTGHVFSSSLNLKDEASDLPMRLTTFVETNPMDLSVQDFVDMYKFPTVTRNRQVDQADYDVLMDTDLVRTLRTRHRQIDFNQFFSDMALGPVAEFFARGIRVGSAEHKSKYGKINHYKDADDQLFGPEPGATDEQSVAHEFGSLYQSG